jgi:hypothetical protein
MTRNRLTKAVAKTLRILPRAAMIAMLIGAPVLAVPSIAGQRDAVIEAPAIKNTGMGFVLLVSLQRR